MRSDLRLTPGREKEQLPSMISGDSEHLRRPGLTRLKIKQNVRKFIETKNNNNQPAKHWQANLPVRSPTNDSGQPPTTRTISGDSERPRRLGRPRSAPREKEQPPSDDWDDPRRLRSTSSDDVLTTGSDHGRLGAKRKRMKKQRNNFVRNNRNHGHRATRK